MPLLAELRKGYWQFREDPRTLWWSIREKCVAPVLQSTGHCPICARKVKFIARDPWLRDHYRCSHCASIPRERAIMHAIELYFPDWRDKIIHESSPGDRGASKKLAKECPGYIASHLFPHRQLGSTVGAYRCEDLSALTFADESVDLHITQDVLEHVLDPAAVFREIGRTLRPGGAHVFTVPLVNGHEPSRRRARADERGKVVYIEPPIFHGNPISAEGSLVTVDWGFDICHHIFEASGLFTHVLHVDDLTKGLRAKYNEVLMTMKTPKGASPEEFI